MQPYNLFEKHYMETTAACNICTWYGTPTHLVEHCWKAKNQNKKWIKWNDTQQVLTGNFASLGVSSELSAAKQNMIHTVNDNTAPVALLH